jgi:hypothetical protein
MSFVVATASPPFTATGAIQVYAYEPFTYRFLFPPGNNFSNFSNTSTNLLGYLTVDATGVNFSSSNGFNSIVSSNANALVIVDNQSNVYSNSVFGGAGRFVDTSGNPLPTRIVVYANEAFTPIPFIPSIAMNPATAFTQPTLPAAMTFSGSNSNLFVLGGQPAATTAASNYVFVVSNALGQVVSANINIQILPERLQLIGGPVDISLTVGVPITPVTFTAIPPIASSNLSFTYPTSNLPSGLFFTDSSGTPVSSYPFRPQYPQSNSIILTGTPTIATPTLGTQVISNTLIANATSVFSGNLSNSTTLTFRYTETVVFTTPSNNAVFSNAFVGLPITPIPFSAASYFGSSYVNRIFSPNLRSDLSLNAASGTANLTGTPTFAGSGTFTATAESVSGVTGSIQFTVVSQNDVVTLSPFVDASLNFIIGRPLSNTLAGYYSSNLTLTATSSAAQPITFVTTGFLDGGITVTTSGTTITFSGVPTALVSPMVATVIASDGLLSVSQSVPFAVLNDVFTWSVVSPTFVQNRVITPVQISATTLSGRVVLSYTASGLPSGLTMSRTGLITGTCFANTGGSFVVTASTGISSQASPPYVYTVVPDALLVSAPLPTYSLVPGQAVPSIPLTGILSSGLTPTSFVLTGQTYGLTITSGGVLGGTLFSGQPPDTLVATANIAVNAVVGTSLVPTSIVLTSTFLPVIGQLWAGDNSLYVAYTYTTSFSNVFGDAAPRLLGTGAPLVYLGFDPSAVPTSSDVQLTTTGRYVASMSGVDDYGTTVIGSVFAGNVNTSTTPTSTFLTAVNGEQTLYRSAFSVAYSGSGTTWYALGVGSTTGVANPNHVYLLRSTDNGETWTLGYITTTMRAPRNWALAVSPAYEVSNLFIDWSNDFFYATHDVNAQHLGSVVLRHSTVADIYMAGGAAGIGVAYSALRITSMEGGPPFGETQATVVPTWTSVTTAAGGFDIETRDFAIDVPAGTPWVAAGSTLYYALSSVKTFDADTLRWSSDNGVTWNSGTNDFTFTASAVTYGGGRWIAIGSDNSGTYYAKRSADGIAWTNITLPASPGLSITSTIVYSNSIWIILVNQRTLFYNTSPTLSSAWVSFTRPFTGDVSRVSVGFSTIYPYGGNSTLAISTQDSGIQLTSPTATAFSIMQFTNMTPITLVLNQSPAFFFVNVSELPVGMRFDPITGTFSGMLMVQGVFNIRVTAKSTAPTFNTFDFTFRVYSPYPQKRQDTASAFTSYVRQEAIIGGAQFSRDTSALPSENTTVGAAMGPFPPEVISAPIICCKLPS